MPAEQSKASSDSTTDSPPRQGWRRELLSPLNIGAVVALLFIWSFTFHQLTQERDRLTRDAQARTQVEAQAFGEYSLGSARRVSEFLLDLRASWLAGREVFEQVDRKSVV